MKMYWGMEVYLYLSPQLTDAWQKSITLLIGDVYWNVNTCNPVKAQKRFEVMNLLHLQGLRYYKLLPISFTYFLPHISHEDGNHL
jgi:hypothetical protein